MKSIITKEQGDYLNKLVSERLDKQLYIICNYEPCELFPATEPSALFRDNISNLYRFSVDCSIVIKNPYLFKNVLNRYDFGMQKFAEKIKYLGDKISNLRSLLFHNVSEYNGYYQTLEINFAKSYIHNILGKDEVDDTNTNDYIKLNDDLEQIAKTLYTNLEGFIKVVVDLNAPDKEAVICSWKDAIIEQYAKDPKIYKGQFMQLLEPIPKDKKRGTVLRETIERIVYYPIDKEMEKLEFANQFGETPKLKLKIRECQEKEVELQKTIKEHYGGDISLYFQKCILKEKMQTKIVDYDRSLLPQCFLQDCLFDLITDSEIRINS